MPAAYADGLPEMQTQHTCILLEDLLDHCNLKCPTCFAESSPARASVAPVAQVLASIDARLSRENGRIDVLMLSGGEPTLYPWLAELLDAVAERPIVRVLVNTNGLRIAQDDELLALLTRHRERVEVYLQYDGESAEASAYHRGADIRRFKERAIERLSANGIFTTLTMTAALGVNDDEIGQVIKRALDTPYVGGVTIQPVFGSGRSGAIDPLDRLTHTGVLARLDEQTAGVVTWRDLTALPCSHPHCCSVGYLLRDDSGTWQSLTTLIGHDRLKQWLDLEPDLLANRIADDAIPAAMKEVVKGSLLDLLSEQSSLSHPSMATIWRDICQNCDLGIGTLTTLATGALPGSAQAAARDAGGAGAAHDGQAVHGHEHDDRGAADAVLRARGHGQRRHRRPPVRAVLRGAGVGAAERHPDLDGDRPAAAGGGAMSDPRIVEPDRAAAPTPYDPLRLCIFATVALLGWVLGPLALAFFAGLGIVGYARARRAGLLRSKCLLGDTRNVLGYLGVLAALAVAGVVWALSSGSVWVPWLAW